MLSRDTIEFAHVTLGLVPKILNGIDVISSLCKELRMIDAELRCTPTRLAAVRAVVPAMKCSIKRSCFDWLIRLFLIVPLIPHNRVI